MPSERKLERRKLQEEREYTKLRRKQIKQNDQYTEDLMDATGNSTIATALKVTAIAGAGILAYKSGAMKPILQPLIKFTHKFAEQSGGELNATLKTVRKWANMGVTNKNVADNISARANSLFRSNPEMSKPYALWDALRKDITAIGENGRAVNIGRTAKNIINDTADDINDLMKMISTERVNTKTNIRSLEHSHLMKNINSFRNTISENQAFNKHGGSVAAQEMMGSIFKENNTLTEEAAQKSLKRLGYRPLVLGDIFDVQTTSHGQPSEFTLKEGIDIEKLGIDPLLKNKKGAKFSEEVFEFFRSPAMRQKGESFFSDDSWKNIIIDSNIMTNGLTGNKMDVVNTTMPRETISILWDSLKNDFKLPLVQFNPIKTFSIIPGVDNWLSNTPKELDFHWISGNEFQPAITRQANKVTARDWAVENLGEKFKNSDVFHVGDKAYMYGEGDAALTQVADRVSFHDIKRARKAYQMPYHVNAMRQMAGLSTATEEFGNLSWEDFKERLPEDKRGKIRELWYKASQKLDLFRSEPVFSDEAKGDFSSRTNIDEWFNEKIDNFVYKFNPNSWIEGFEDKEKMIQHMKDKSYAQAFNFDPELSRTTAYGNKVTPAAGVLTIKPYTVTDIVKAAQEHGFRSKEFSENLQGLVAQYGSGFFKDGTMGNFYTEATSKTWGLFNALDQGLDQVGLGLSLDSKRSVGSYMANLMLKRALPAYLLTKVPGMVEYFSEPFFTAIDKKKHENDPDYDDSQPHNITQWAANHIVRPIDIRAHQIMDLTGITNLFKFVGKMTPGSDQINELPGIYHLGLGQTTAEREEYIEEGYDPIRKARYWSSGNTPFTGGKIDHWRPNLYRRINADVKFSGSKFGSRQEYYDNTWFPNLVNPLAPLNHFVLDRHHWDKKHYYDRPYLVHSGDALTQMPWFGPLFDAVERPFQGKMHKEYWDGNKPIMKPDDEAPNPILLNGISGRSTGIRLDNIFKNIGAARFISSAESSSHQERNISTLNAMDIRMKISNREFANMLAQSAYQSKILVDKVAARDRENRMMQYSDLYVTDQPVTRQKAEFNDELSSSVLPYRSYDRYGTPLEVYITPGGRVKIVDVPDNLNLYKVNEEIKHYSLNKIYGTNQRVNISEYSNPDMAIGNDMPEIDNYFKFSMGDTFEQFGDVAGLRGFMIQQFVTGKANQSGAVIESSGYSYGNANEFWEQNWGGFGGELSEISRRFIPQKNNKVEYINPIRNTMPNWMPGRNYFIDFLHGDPYTKVMNGEERLPGEGYERLNHINLGLGVDISQIGKSREELVKHFLHQDEERTWADVQHDKAQGSISEELDEMDIRGISNRKRRRTVKRHINKMGDDYYGSFTQFTDNFIDFFRGTNRGHDEAERIRGNISDSLNNINGKYDAIVRDMSSPTGKATMMIKSVDEETFNKLYKGRKVMPLDYSQLNYQLWATSKGRNKGYIRYVNAQDPNQMFERSISFNQRQLNKDLTALSDARKDINYALRNGQIGRGELYSLLDRFRVLADVAPYSQEYKDVAAKLAQAHLTTEQREEAKKIRERAKAQKESLRVYEYKFSTADTKHEKVHVKEIIDNNTIITEEYGRSHAIKFAGIRVSESNTDLYNPVTRKYKDKAGRIREGQFSKYTKNQAARRTLDRYLKPGSVIDIEYDADESRKYSVDSTRSIRAVIHKNGVNINRRLIDKGLAKEKEEDNSPAAIRARYSKGQIAFGSAMETITHKGVAAIPFVGQKFMQVRSPYESYRDREVYGKDFQSWNHPIRDIFLPNMVDRPIGDKRLGGIFPIVMGAFLGSMFGNTGFGKMVGASIGASIPAIGKLVTRSEDGKREWRPKRRREQEDINTYIDTLKYVKNMRLYNQYADKALKENNFNVRQYLKEKEEEGEYNKEKQRELTNYKKRVKLDFKHHTGYNFEYGEPKYVEKGMSRKEVISAINKEIAEIQSKRKVEKLPENAIKAIAYEQEAHKTMYAYEPGDDLSQYMAALPNKDRKYFQYFMDAPEKEKDKILSIAPNYMRRALQFSWRRPVDSKEDLVDYFKEHALPDQYWEGWKEDTNIDDVKVKMVNQLKQDPGEFNIWQDDKRRADQTNIPIPILNKHNNAAQIQSMLTTLLTQQGFEDIQFGASFDSNSNRIDFTIAHDERKETEEKIKRMNIYE